MDDESAFVRSLRVHPPSAPSPALRARIFGSAWSRWFRLSVAAAALLLLGQVLGLVSTRSHQPSRVVLGERLIESGSTMAHLEARNKNIRLFMREEP